MPEVRPIRKVSFYPVDWLVLGYCLLMAVVLILLGRPLSRYSDELIFYLAAAAITVLIVRYVDETCSRWHAFLRFLYPALLLTFFYRMTGGQMSLLFDRFFDNQVVWFEQTVVGLNPTLYIDQHLLNVWITEILSFCYFCYYLILPGFLIPVFLRRDDWILREYLAAACLTFFVSYLLFWLYPVEGPRWFLSTEYVNNVEGPLFRQLVAFVIDKAAVRGGAMPSSHTGAALVTLIFCFRYYRRAAWWLLPIVVGLALGTVWGRFHYASDVLVGAAIGAVAVWIVWKYLDHRATAAHTRVVSQTLRTQDVS
jgi:membrane-associated phospholipid phosphatase